MSIKSKIIIYSTSWCGDCIRSKALFDDFNIKYNDINIENDQDALDYVVKVNKGSRSVPTIIFPDEQIMVEPSNADLILKLKELNLID